MIDLATLENYHIRIVSRSDVGDLLLEVTGPQDTPFQGNKYMVLFRYTKDYPYCAPTIQFLTGIFHPNISEEGFVCLDILQDEYSPALTASTYMLSVVSIFGDPNTTDHLTPQLLNVFSETRISTSTRTEIQRRRFPTSR